MSHYEHDADGVVIDGTAMEIMAPSAIALLNASEIDQQISTAKRYPRSLTTFTKEVKGLVTLDQATAQSCIYALPRAGKTIEGASVRFAEIVNYAWANTRVATRIVEIGDEFITVEGLFFDLEKNTAIRSEVLRRITNRKGEKFDADMIQTTGAAAGAIARRNAILVGIPKTLWAPMYEASRQCVAGDIRTLANQRAEAIKAFAIFGVKPEQVYGLLGVAGVEDVTRDHLVTLAGVKTAIDDKSISPEEAFSADKMKQPGSAGRPDRKDFVAPDRKQDVKTDTAKDKPKPNGDKTASNSKPAGKGKDEFKESVEKAIESSKALATVKELDELDDKICDAISQVKRDDELRPIWNAAYAEAKKRIEGGAAAEGSETAADDSPAESEDDRQHREYREWLATQYAELAKVNTVAEVDGMQDSVGNELAGDADETKKWADACTARIAEIRAARRR